MGRIARIILGIGFATCLGSWVAWATDSSRAMLVALPIAFIAAFGSNNKSGCAFLRGLAWVHVVLALLMIRVYTEQMLSALDYLGYVARNIFVAGLVIVFMLSPVRPADSAGLPPGYEYLNPAAHRLSPLDRLLMVSLVSFCAAALMAGWLLILALLIPVGFALFYIVKILRTRRTPPPTSARRLKLSPKMQRPAQTRSHYTVNDAQFDDPELYDQR